MDFSHLPCLPDLSGPISQLNAQLTESVSARAEYEAEKDAAIFKTADKLDEIAQQYDQRLEVLHKQLELMEQQTQELRRQADTMEESLKNQIESAAQQAVDAQAQAQKSLRQALIANILAALAVVASVLPWLCPR